MLIRRLLISVVLLLFLLSSCGDDNPTKPTPAETFELKIAVVDSTGAPVEGLQVSTWTDTVVVAAEQSAEGSSSQPADSQPKSVAFAPRKIDSHLYGDVDCDGVPFARSDVIHIRYYIARSPQPDSADVDNCVEMYGDVVPATEGVTVADYFYTLSKHFWDTIPDGRTFRQGEATYTYDDFSGVLSFPDRSGVRAALVTYEKDGFNPPELIAPGAGEYVFALSGFDDRFYYVLIQSMYSLGGKVLECNGKLVAIDAAADMGRPLHLTRVAHQQQIGSWDSDLSDSVFTYRLYQSIMRPVDIKIYDPANRQVDETIIDTWTGRPFVWRPDSLFSTVYRFEMEVVEAEGLVVRDTAFGIFWSDDPARTIVGQTDSDGALVVSDIRLFPSLFDLPTLLVADTMYPYEGSQFIFSDSVTVHVRDTSTGEFKEQRFLLMLGPNEVTVVWP